MALRATSSGQNKSYPNQTDRLGGALDWIKALVAGGFWRYKHQGDGRSAYQAGGSSSLFTSNSGTGYTTTNQAWNTTIANSWYNPLAYVVLEELNNSGATTGRQMLLQRGNVTSAAGDNKLVHHFAHGGFTGTANATTAPATGTTQALAGTINGAGAAIMASLTDNAQAVINGNANIIWDFWDCDRASGTTSNIATCGFIVYSATSPDFAWQFWYEALVQAAAADSHPYILMSGAWAGISRETYADASSDIYGNASNATCFALDSAGAYRRAGGDKWTSGGRGLLTPGSSIAAMTTDADSKYPLEPVRFTVDSGGASDAFKGYSETLGRIRPISSAQAWPCQISCSDGTFYLSLGQSLCAPWPNIATTPTGYSLATSSAFVRKGFATTPDTTAPTITISPSPGAVGITQALTIDVFDAGAGVASYSVDIDYTTLDRHEFVGEGAPGSFSIDDHFNAASSETTITNGKRLVFSRDLGWPDGFTVTVRAVDAAGNRATPVTATFTMSSASTPSLSSASPTNGSAIALTGTGTLTFADTLGLSLVSLQAAYSSVGGKTVTENIYDGASFGNGYSGSVTGTTSVAAAFTRTRGWPAAVDINYVVKDTENNSISGTVSWTLSNTNATTLSSVSPAAGAISYAQALAVTPTDSNGIRSLSVRAQFSDRTETIYDANGYAAPYDTSSTINTSSSTAWVMSITRDVGWSGDFTLRFTTTDLDGVVTQGSLAYTISGTNPAAPDASAPTVTVISPADGHLSKNTPITLEVDDDHGIRYFVLYATWGSNEVPAELVANSRNRGLTTLYTVTWEVVGGKQRLTVLRKGGWERAPTFQTDILDTAGNLA